MNARATATGLRVLALLLGVFLITMGLGKRAWLLDSGPLVSELQGWMQSAPAVSRWYIETIAMPGAPLFARLVLFGEVASGTALIVGFRIRLAATLALAMVLNFHVAMGVIFDLGYLTNGYGLPVVSGLVALAIGGGRLPFSLSTGRRSGWGG